MCSHAVAILAKDPSMIIHFCWPGEWDPLLLQCRSLVLMQINITPERLAEVGMVDMDARIIEEALEQATVLMHQRSTTRTRFVCRGSWS